MQSIEKRTERDVGGDDDTPGHLTSELSPAIMGERPRAYQPVVSRIGFPHQFPTVATSLLAWLGV